MKKWMTSARHSSEKIWPGEVSPYSWSGLCRSRVGRAAFLKPPKMVIDGDWGQKEKPNGDGR